MHAPGAAPLVIAHRGSSSALPEHTLAAYRRALDEGADGLECDVRLSRDGHLVCLHDRRLDRVSNGRGRVSAHTLAQLERLDYGSWRGTGPAPLLTLDQLLRAVREHAGRPIQLLIETKHPSRFGPAVERRLVALLHRHGLADPATAGPPGAPIQVTVMSFSALALARTRRLAPALPTVLLLDLLPPGWAPPPGWPRLGRGHRRLPAGAQIAGPSIRLLRARPGLLPALRAAGYPVYVWTVNKPKHLALVRWEADAVITDRPAEIRAALAH